MANTAHLFRRQSSRDLVPSSYHNQRSIDNLELKVSEMNRKTKKKTIKLDSPITRNKKKLFSYKKCIQVGSINNAH